MRPIDGERIAFLRSAFHWSTLTPDERLMHSALAFLRKVPPLEFKCGTYLISEEGKIVEDVIEDLEKRLGLG